VRDRRKAVWGIGRGHRETPVDKLGQLIEVRPLVTNYGELINCVRLALLEQAFRLISLIESENNR
jgi:hypothetical protein